MSKLTDRADALDIDTHIYDDADWDGFDATSAVCLRDIGKAADYVRGLPKGSIIEYRIAITVNYPVPKDELLKLVEEEEKLEAQRDVDAENRQRALYEELRKKYG